MLRKPNRARLGGGGSALQAVAHTVPIRPGRWVFNPYFGHVRVVALAHPGKQHLGGLGSALGHGVVLHAGPVHRLVRPNRHARTPWQVARIQPGLHVRDAEQAHRGARCIVRGQGARGLGGRGGQTFARKRLGRIGGESWLRKVSARCAKRNLNT